MLKAVHGRDRNSGNDRNDFIFTSPIAGFYFPPAFAIVCTDWPRHWPQGLGFGCGDTRALRCPGVTPTPRLEKTTGEKKTTYPISLLDFGPLLWGRGSYSVRTIKRSLCAVCIIYFGLFFIFSSHSIILYGSKRGEKKANCQT